MDESGEHHPPQTDTRTENQIPYILTRRRVLNSENTWTLESVWGVWGRDSVGWGGWGEITWGEIPDIGDGGMEAANHLAMYVPMQQSCIICTCTPETKVQFF